MVSKRQEELLKLIVEDYIKNARPVGSKALCDSMKCSSATNGLCGLPWKGHC